MLAHPIPVMCVHWCLGPGRSSRAQPLIASYYMLFTKGLFILLKSGANCTYQCKSSGSLKILGCDFWKYAGSTSKTFFSCMTLINDCSYRTIYFIISSSMNLIHSLHYKNAGIVFFKGKISAFVCAMCIRPFSI